jgi:hypothetical protein
MIAIFLNNKLITTDTVVPMTLAVKRIVPKRRIRFYVFDEDTYRSIRENTVLWDAINRVGSLVCFTRSGKGLGRKLYLLRIMMLLAPLAVRCALGKARLVHFKALNGGPLSILSQLNERRTLIM